MNYKHLYIPLTFKLTLVKNIFSKKTIIIAKNENYKLLLLTPENFFLDVDLQCLNFLNKNKKNILVSNYFDYFLKTLESYFFFKIKFKGKGFKIKIFKKSKMIKFFFGKSHPTVVLIKNTKLKRIGKYKFIIKNLILQKLKFISSMIIKIKPTDIYTLRGLRLSKQIIIKKKGKKSSYI